MMNKNDSKMIVVRGAGDLATGTIHRLRKAGFAVLALETEHPMAIRRHVAFSEAVVTGEAEVEGVRAVRVNSIEEARRVLDLAGDGAESAERTESAESSGRILQVPVLVDPRGRCIQEVKPAVLVDAILAKKNLGTHRGMAPLTIALGPGFTAGEDVDYVIETMRGHSLGRIISGGQAIPNTGVPGVIGGCGAERVIHAPASGILQVIRDIGDTVEAGEVIALIKDKAAEPKKTAPKTLSEKAASGQTVADQSVSEKAASNQIASEQIASDSSVTEVRSQISGLLRGMIRDGTPVRKGLKIADVDPRTDQLRNCFTISDKSRCIAGSVLELVCAAAMRDFGKIDTRPAAPPARRIGCVLMAAGWSKRFGADKLLVSSGGKPLVTRIISQLRKLADAVPEAEPLVAARRPEVAALADVYGLEYVLYEGGEQSDTIRMALGVPAAERWDGCMFIPADQPLLTAQSMEMLLRAFLKSPEEIHRLCTKDRPGNPVVFPAACFPALRKLHGDVGGREVIRRGGVPVRMHMVRDSRELTDVDSSKELARLREELL